ncbi:M15 family metallopeptidase [uncultured Nocardioides sp.]|uniref:M15 family metallopeptidase n=1 Tax=uncultured Nocardioides sp. TaxID=198441 RepID=UPI0026223D2B|nr:M15 family metallopeptidase [uncultured Nocardioides sp.]
MRLRRTRSTAATAPRPAAALAGALVVAAVLGCSAPASEVRDQAVPDEGATSASGGSTPSGDVTTGPSLDPAYAVDPPGRFKALPRTADVVVQTQETIDEETLAKIERIPGVAAVEQFSMLQVSIENRVLNVAAVDPATYRRYAPGQLPQNQEIWDRVAAGELAVGRAVARRLPLDDDDFLQLTSEVPPIHLGVMAPQIENAVDAVVNEKWGEALGATPGNALLVSSELTVAPEVVAEPLTKLLPKDSSIERLDAVARYGLDPDAVQTAQVVGSLADAIGVFTYRPIGGGRIAPDPAWVRTHISTQSVPILGDVTCNNAIFPQLRAALEEIVTAGLADEIKRDQYAGCYYPRFIAGSTSLSNHSFGTALDLNVPGNLRGTVGEMDRVVVSIFKKWGFAWGGDWSYTDPMHFEMARIVRPG